MRDLTQWFYDNLFLPLDQILIESEDPFDTNDIIQMTGVIIGRQGSGKSMIARSLCDEALRRYGMGNVNPVWSRDFELLIYRGPINVPVNILYYDDATLQKIDRDTMRDFFRIRHITKDVTGRTNGLVINIIGTHRYFSISKDLRSGCEFLIFKDTPINPYDYNLTKRFIGDAGTGFLDEVNLKKFSDRDLFAWSVFYMKREAGALFNPKPKRNTMYELYARGRGQEIRV
jgi:hypothetical protein